MHKRRHLVVLGRLANAPYAGMAWMHAQFLMGLRALGHDVTYIETTSTWPYLPLELTVTDNPDYSLRYLADVMTTFGLDDAWAYRARYADDTWYGPRAARAIDLLQSADAVLNITGATTPEEIGVPCRLVYIGTDPVLQEMRIANGDEVLRRILAAHIAHFTYGENIGASDCPVPPLPFPTHPTRQPIVIGEWANAGPPRDVFTTVTNWEVSGYDITFGGESYTWSKRYAFERIASLPRLTTAKLEMAMGLSGVSDEVRQTIEAQGWSVTDAFAMTLHPRPYQAYVRASMAGASVAKDLVARTRSGWFSERSACYLAAGRPVVTEDTGFGCALPTGEGLIAFRTLDEARAGIEAVRSDYDRHSRAASAIAEEYFRAERILSKLLADVGL